NAFDEPASEVDPAQHVTTFDYDTLGRLLTRSAPDGNDSFTWDSTALGGKGRLHSQQRGDVSTTYAYDSFGKVQNEQWTIRGTPYNYDYAYDGAGRLKTILYPSVPGRARFGVSNTYSTWGHLYQVNDITTASAPKMLWTATLVDDSG